MSEYPKHVHKKGGAYKVVNSKDEEQQALGQGWKADLLDVQEEEARDAKKDALAAPQQDPSRITEIEEREERVKRAKADRTEAVRSGDMRADHEAKMNAEVSGKQRAEHEARANAEQEAAKRGDDSEQRPEDFIRPGDKPNATNKGPDEDSRRPEDMVRRDDKPNALNKKR